ALTGTARAVRLLLLRHQPPAGCCSVREPCVCCPARARAKARARIRSPDLGTSRSRSAIEGRPATNSARPSADRATRHERRGTLGQRTEENKTPNYKSVIW